MSGDLIQLWDKGVLLQGIWETIYLTFISSFVAYVFGLPIGVLLTVTDKDGIHPIPWLNKIIGILVNIFRSIPFIILMVACLPAAKFIVGTSLGNKAMIVMLVIAARRFPPRHRRIFSSRARLSADSPAAAHPASRFAARRARSCGIGAR